MTSPSLPLTLDGIFGGGCLRRRADDPRWFRDLCRAGYHLTGSFWLGDDSDIWMGWTLEGWDSFSMTAPPPLLSVSFQPSNPFIVCHLLMSSTCLSSV